MRRDCLCLYLSPQMNILTTSDSKIRGIYSMKKIIKSDTSQLPFKIYYGQTQPARRIVSGMEGMLYTGLNSHWTTHVPYQDVIFRLCLFPIVCCITS